MILCRRRFNRHNSRHRYVFNYGTSETFELFGYLLQNHTASTRSRRLIYPTLRRCGNAMMKHLREE